MSIAGKELRGKRGEEMLYESCRGLRGEIQHVYNY
jgi:hypothetical protein